MTTLNKELNITIVGLGVIGGSFAMALHDAGYRTADMMADGCTRVGCTEMCDRMLEHI